MSTASRIDTAPAPSSEERANDILSPEALDFVAELHGRFESRRQELLAARRERADELQRGGTLDFLEETREIREGDWQVAAPAEDWLDRRVEITGPTDRKLVINALNSGAKGFMADFEDATAPTWENVVVGHVNLIDAIDRTITYDASDGKHYELDEETATLLVRPRGWHLNDKHVHGRGHRGLRRAARLRALLLPQRPAPARRRLAAVLLPAQAGAPPRGAAVERRPQLRRGGRRRPARHLARDGADRDAARRVPDGRDPLRAARALLRPQRRPLGLHLLHDQVLPRPRGLRPPGPQRREDDGAVHEGLHGAARQDLPRPRRLRDGRHGGADPLAQGRGGQPARDRRRCARTRSARRRPASTAPGSRTRTSSTSRSRRSTPCSATSPTRSTSSAPTSR